MLLRRQEREAIEQAGLAPYGLASAASKGRQYPESEDTYRTAFQRDRDRILHTTAFRRLEYKTQVFVNHEGDYYRTRLTHSLEVAQIGRTIARALGANEDLVEAICLAHDLGHTPFGHAGEAILNQLMADYGGYNHNVQTYRIVTQLEQRYPQWPGLNLTHELREGIAKHQHEVPTGHPSDSTDSAALRGSLEAQIANLADELAYNAHDLDDGLRAGLLQPIQVAGVALVGQVSNTLGISLTVSSLGDSDRHALHRTLLSAAIEDVVVATDARLTAANLQTALAIQQQPADTAAHSADFAKQSADLKAFLYAEFYYHYRVIRMANKAHRILTQLFESFCSAPKQLPPDVQAQITGKGLQRAVADYIAGMTDRYALQEWERLYAPFART
jgi:dGTPase